MSPVEMVEAARTLAAARRFLFSDRSAAMLDAIGDVGLRAAADAFRNARLTQGAEHHRRELALALGHLQSAHQAYDKLYASPSPGMQILDPQAAWLAALKDARILMLMALCYALLNDRVLARQTLDRLMRVYDRFEGEPTPADWLGFVLGFINPLFYYRLYQTQGYADRAQAELFRERCLALLEAGTSR